MINLFKKNIHSFLSFTLHTTTTTTTTDDYKLQLHHPISGLGLITATNDADKPRNVLESATLKPNGNLPPPPPLASPTSNRGIEFIDDVGGGVDRLMYCTESLGFESSDERRVNNDDNDDDDDDDDDGDLWRRRRMMRAEGRGNSRKVRSFPPLLSSLNRNGKPSFFLRPVRKDGRLELTEVRIHRPEILHASRHNGRLTLHLIPDQSILEEEEELEEDEELVQEEEEEAIHAQLEEEIIVEKEEEDEVVEEIRYVKEEEEEEERVGEWRFVAMGGNEGFWRCHEMVNQHHHDVHGSHHHHLRLCGISIV